jgi:acetyl-CoA C-acetyltransferase
MTNVTPVWIVRAKRTPHGKFLGGLVKYSAVDLATRAAAAALDGIDRTWVDSVIVGNVLSAGQGMNVARQVGIGVGLPVTTPAFTVNMMCASGMQAVRLAVQAIQNGDASLVLCGGTESMSNGPYLLARARSGYKLGHGELIDSVLRDGVTDVFSNEHMGLTAERLAERYQISRREQDEFALRSHARHGIALASGHYRDEIVAVDKILADEPPRPDSTIEGLAALRPAFHAGGTVTAGNASGLNDGAAMLLVCSEEFGSRHGLAPMMLITRTAVIGCEPSLMGLGPAYVTRRISADPSEFDLIELNEAFAAQSLACVKELRLDEAKVNVDGGAIALGHPIGASGARLLAHLAHRRPKRGLATLCVGGGMGCAVVLERP